jgi:hypothetical protein
MQKHTHTINHVEELMKRHKLKDYYMQGQIYLNYFQIPDVWIKELKLVHVHFAQILR